MCQWADPLAQGVSSREMTSRLPSPVSGTISVSDNGEASDGCPSAPPTGIVISVTCRLLPVHLAGLFKMFSDPTRVKILNILLEGEKCVGDVAAQMNMSTAAVSHHLRMLRQGNLVTDHRQGKEVFYALADDHVTSILSLGMEHVTE